MHKNLGVTRFPKTLLLLVLCSGFLSIAVINTTTKSNLGKEANTSRSQSITEESQDRTQGSLKQRPQRNAACWLSCRHRLLQPWISYPGNSVNQSGLGPPTSINKIIPTQIESQGNVI